MYTDTDGIVFRQVKAPAGRRMVLIFTRKYGKISVGSSITEGKGRSKAALAVRPFTYGRYDLFVNRGYYDLNSAEVKRSYYSLGENLDKYNAALKELAREKGYHFADVASVMKVEDGSLNPDYCSDPEDMGIHFTDAGAKVWIDYLLENAQDF